MLISLCAGKTRAQSISSDIPERSNPDSITYFLHPVDSLDGNVAFVLNEHLTINSDSRIETLIRIHQDENIRQGGITGYRVQLFQGNKENAYQMKARFIARYEDIPVYIRFYSPDFKVRIGDFRTRSEAIKWKYTIEKDFPDAFLFIVEDRINYPGQ